MEAIKRTLDVCNNRYADSLAAPLEVNYGDEIAGLFVRAAPVYPVATALRGALHPHAGFRFAVSRERIGYAGGALREMGGPVFQIASDSLRALKSAGRFSAWRLGDDVVDRTLEALVNLADAHVAAMTTYQFQVFTLLEQEIAQKEIARRLGKYPQSVSKAVKTSHADLIIDAQTVITSCLERFDQSNCID